MNTEKPEYSIVIPTYRGAAALPQLMERLSAVMDRSGKTYEIIVVDDDSPDHSWDVIKELKRCYPRLRALKLMSNVGQFRALMCGFDHVRGAYVITMDDDLQNPPEEIPKLITGLADHPDMDGVIGAYTDKKHSLWRRLGSGLIHWVNRLVSHKPPDLQTTSFRLLRRHLVDAISEHQTMNPVMGPLVVQNSRRLMNVTVEHHPRKLGTSNYTLLGLIKLSLDHVLNFSVIPLKIVSIIGIISALISVGLGSFYLIRYLTTDIGTQVKGWTTVVLLVTFFSGLMLFSIGLIGEYLIRIIREVSHAPRYVVREVI